MSTSVLYALLISAIILSCHCHEEQREIHVVYMGEKPAVAVAAASSMHHSTLQDVVGSSGGAKDSLVYSYARSFNGFAAKLTKEEAARIEEMEGVVSVLPNTIYNLHTTRSWDFMGMTTARTIRVPAEGDVVVGLLDTGIWPESQSFGDYGLGPPPSKWKGTCQAVNFTCNNKIIGARYYNSRGIYGPTDFKSPRDSEGHGSHTSSTAAGVQVPDTSYFGLGQGTVHGAVPRARIAMYKVCWSEAGCALADILAAFDDAISDGVDIISVSLGGDPAPYLEDPIAIGSFHAMRKGILTVNSAGNSGPFPGSVSNTAPWTVTVAASSIDRKFIAKVVLGDGQTFIGNSINRFNFNSVGSAIPLVYGGDAPNVSAGAFDEISRLCIPHSLNTFQVESKIVLCNSLGTGEGVRVSKGIGTIMSTSFFTDFAFSYPLPATVVSDEDAATILAYIQSTSNPIANILPGETMYDVMAPTVVSFSSRGPNLVDPNILKPDLTAPGVDILAAWSPVASPSISEDDPTRVNYNVISGTSMSCPHVSGAAAYIKSVHPQWSPAAIKSALMTTAMVMDPRKHKGAEFAYGAGHIDPIKALNPGLVFDASEQDYIDFLCTRGYNETTLKLVTGHSSQCSNSSLILWDSLNYPSFALAIPDGQPISGAFQRRVTNVGTANSTYYATVYAPSAFTVTVTPSALSFSSVGQTRPFVVTVKGGVIWQQEIISGYILWCDGTHEVRTPIAVYTVLPERKGSTSVGSRSFSGSSLYRKNRILGRN